MSIERKMQKKQLLSVITALLFVCTPQLFAVDYQPLVSELDVKQQVEAFAHEMETKHGFDGKLVRQKLNGLRHRQDIIERITKPAEGMPWHRYRKIWMKDQRINAGVEFWNLHQSTLKRAYDVYGVPPEIIVGIIGVETFYGRIQGDFPVIEALHTLGFYYPKRAKFFRSELVEFLLLAREQGWSWDQVKGSYAGAMGMGQFISSSYRAYGVDFNGDGQVNLFSDPVDMIGSVANYFKKHRWSRDGFVAQPITLTAEQQTLVQTTLPLVYDLEVLAKSNIDVSGLEQRSKKAGIFAFELTDGGHEYWIGGENFYTITRYNHNAMYALAVYQLSQAVAAKRAKVTQ